MESGVKETEVAKFGVKLFRGEMFLLRVFFY